MTRRGLGRPSTYRPEYAAQAEKFCRLGATDRDLAEFFEVAESTLNLWKLEHPEFSESLKAGKSLADVEIADKLYHRARGYSHEAVKIFMPAGADAPVIVPYVEHYPPDTTAAIFWLKNRRPDLWRDRQQPVAFPLPADADLPKMLGVVLGAVADGTLTPSEGVAVGQLIEAKRRIIETTELEARIAALEQAQGRDR